MDATIKAEVWVEDAGEYCEVSIIVPGLLKEAYYLDEEERRRAAEGVRKCLDGELSYAPVLPAFQSCDPGGRIAVYGARWEVVVCINGLEAALKCFEAERLAEELEVERWARPSSRRGRRRPPSSAASRMSPTPWSITGRTPRPRASGWTSPDGG